MNDPFEVLRGTTPEQPREEENGGKPRNAASYCAQFGIPLEDIEQALKQYRSHDEVMEWLRKEYISDSRFRAASLALKTRPFGDLEPKEPRSKKGIEGPIDDPGFTRPANFMHGEFDFKRNASFYRCELSVEEVDALIEVHRAMQANQWMRYMSQDVLRVYVMSVLQAEGKDPDAVRELYYEGKAWEKYG